MVYDCPVPAGFEAESARRMAEFTSRTFDDPAKTGWYAADLPVPLSTNYSAPWPLSLDIADTPLYLGLIWAGPGYGDRIDRHMVCGHSIETHGWTALVEALGAGYATFDVRDALEGQPLPTEEGNHSIAPHSFRFEIGGVSYQFIVFGVTVGLQKVWRPDLVQLGKLGAMLGARRRSEQW